jgi:hypothetical protein
VPSIVRASSSRVRNAANPLCWACLLAACAPAVVAEAPRASPSQDAAAKNGAREAGAGAVRDGFFLPDLVGGGEVTGPMGKVLVYAHSGSDLFRVDPETFAIERAGNLTLRTPDGKTKYINDVTDIAVDRNGRVLGLRYARSPAGPAATVSELVQIDPETAECTRVAGLPPENAFNGLSWIRTADNGEYLAGTTYEGLLFRIDPVTGAASKIGAFGAGLGSSGDIVSVTGYGTLATLNGTSSDQLARIDPVTGQATVIGPITGFRKIYGIGFWGNRVYGFTNSGQLILIDPKTAAATEISATSAYPFAGAGVTTSVPVIVE